MRDHTKLRAFELGAVTLISLKMINISGRITGST